MANLVGPETQLPEIHPFPDGQIVDLQVAWPRILEQIDKLDDSVKSELLGYFAPDSERYKNWVRDHKEFFHRNKIDQQSYMAGLQVWETLWHYERICAAHEYLRMLARAQDEKAFDALEELVVTLRYANLSYLRQCANEKCGRIFYATKSTQPGCTPRCSDVIRKRRKRERDRAAKLAKYELAEGKKRAQKRLSISPAGGKENGT